MAVKSRPGAARALALLLGLASLLLGACAASTPSVELGGQRFAVEIADEPREQAMGLMFREELDEDSGMLFVFRAEAPRSFWMKNCRIPLDILYFDADLRLINAHHDVPPCRTASCPSYHSDAPAKYVLELNGGVARELRLRPGDQLRLDL